jgi:glycosyltransferase involved in cell wall biosynthesis
MKIVLPVHHFPPHYTAGAELYTYRLARWLIEHGHSAEVVCIEAIDSGEVGHLNVVHDAYQGVPVWRLSYNIIDARERRRWDFDNPLIGHWFSEYIAQYKPDIAHFQAGYLLSAAPFKATAAADVPIILTLHDYWFLCPRITLQRGDGTLCENIPADPAGCAWCQCTVQRRYSIADRYSAGLVGAVARQVGLRPQTALIDERRKTLANVLKLVNVAIAPSKYLASRYAPLVAESKLHVLRYGLDLSRFQEVSVRDNDTPIRIGFTGQIAPHKGVHLLVDAFRRVKTGARAFELHLYGGLESRPDYAASLREQAKGDPRIYFHGRFENVQAPSLLAKLDLAVVPSVWYENSPLAISEAHAAGVPVITARLGGMAELVQDQVDGLHFAPNDAADLARVLQQIVDHPELLSQLRHGITAPPSIDDESGAVVKIYERALMVASARSLIS